MNRMTFTAIFALSLLTSLTAGAQSPPSAIHFQGQILDSNGIGLNGSGIIFTLQVVSPTNCVLYQEQQTLNMSGSSGVFDLALGTGTQASSPSYALKKVFSNSGTFTGLDCGTYTPASGDTRSLKVTFYDGSQTIAFSTPYTITSVPYALQADSLQGFGAGDLIQVNSSTKALTQANLEAVFDTPADVTALTSLIAGTSSLYARPGAASTSFTGAVSFTNDPTTSAAPSTGNSLVNKTYSDDYIGGKAVDASIGTLAAGDAGKTLQWNGTDWIATTASTLDSTKLPLAGGTMTGAIAMGGYDLTNTGYITISGSHYLGLGTYTNASEATLVSTLNGTYKGVTWYNVTSGTIKFWNGSSVVALGPSSGGTLTALTGDVSASGTGSVAATVNSVGTSTAANVHAAEVLANAATSANTASTIVKRDASGNFTAGAASLTSASVSSVIYNDSGSNTVTVSAPSSVTSSYSLKWPLAVGSANQVLSTDASGNLSWVTPSAGSVTSVGVTGPITNSGSATAPVIGISMSGDATINGSGVVTLKNTGTAGTYTKVTTDAQGRVMSATNIGSSDVTTALGYTPVNKAGDTMSGALNMGGNDLTSTGNIGMGSGKTLLLGSYTNAGESTLASALTNTSADIGKAWYNTTSGQIKFWNGTTVVTLGAAGSGLQSLTAGTGLTGGTITTSGTIAVNVGTGANQIVQLDGSSKLPAVDGSALSNLNASNLASGTLAAGRLPALSGDVTSSAGSSATTVTKLQGNAVKTGVPGTNGQVLTWVAANSDWEPIAPATSGTVTSFSAADSSVFTVTNPTTTPSLALNSQLQNLVLASPTSGSGSPTFRNLNLTDLHSSLGGGALFPAPNCTSSQTLYWQSSTDTFICQNIGSLAWSSISSGLPTTLSGYGITDAVKNAGGTPSVQSGLDASKPASPSAGAVYIASDSKTIYQYNSGAWVAIATSTGSGGSVTSVTANNGLSGGTFTTSGTIGLSSIANNTFLANTSGASGVPTATTLTALIDSSIGNTQGNILYRDTNANGWKVLAPGTAGQVLASGGASANPTWATPTAGTLTALTGDVSASGTGSVAATVNSVGTSTAANVHAAEVLANAATSANTASTIVKRDASGNFTAGAASLTSASVSSVIYNDSGSNTVTVSAPSSVTSSYSLKWPLAVGSANQVLSTDASGNLSWVTPSAGSVTSVGVTGPITNSGSATAPVIGISMSGDATINGSGVVTLKNTGTAGTYTKVTTDAQGRVMSATNIGSSDVTTALGYTPVNKAGDTMSGALNMGGNDLTSTGNIGMGSGKTLLLGSYTNAGESTLASALTNTSADIGKAWYNTTSGQIKFWNGTTVVTLGAAGSGLQSLTAGTGLTGGTITTSGTIAVNVGTGANQIVQLDGSSKLPAVDGSALSNLNASNLASGTLAAGRLPALSGDVTSSAGSSATTVTKLQGNAVKTGVPGTNGQVLTWVAANSDWEPIAPATSGTVTSVALALPSIFSVTNSPVTSSGTLTGSLATQTMNTVLAGPTSGAAAAPTFRNLNLNDLHTSIGGLGPLFVSPGCSTSQTLYWQSSTDTFICQNIGSLAWSSISSGLPTTLSGYGITDAVKNAGGTPSVQSGLDASKPASPSAGAVYIASDSKTIYQYNSGAWVAIATSTGSGGSVTSVTANNGLSGGSFTTSGTIGLSSIANNTFLANTSGASGVPTATTLTALIDSSIGNTQGNILYRDTNANGWKVLAPGTAGQVLASGGASANPTWATASSGSVTSVTANNGLSGGTFTTSGTIGLSSIANNTFLANTSGSSGTPSATSNLSPFLDLIGSTQGSVLYRGASGWSVLSPGTAGQVLASGGASANPTWASASSGSVTGVTAGTGLTGGTITTSGTIAVNVGTGANQIVQLDGSSKLPAVDGSALSNLNASNLASGTLAAGRLPALSGDVTSSAGSSATTVTKLQGNAVKTGVPGTNGQVLTWVAANSDWEPIAPATSGTVTSVTAGNGLSGGAITSSGTINLASIANNTFLANTSGGSSYPTASNNLSPFLDVYSSTQGAVLYRGSSGWAALAPGSAGQVLSSGGASANPTWGSASGGTVTSVALALPSIFSVTNSPVTSSGTLTGSLATQTMNTVLAGPTSGAAAAPTFRNLNLNDLHTSIGGLGPLFVSPGCSTSQTLYWQSSTDTFICQNIGSLAWSSISSGLPTTLSGYGITDAVKNAGGTPSVQSGLDASKPASPSAGAVYIASDSKTIYQYNSGAWVAIATSTGSGGSVTGVTAGTGLTGGTITTSGTIAVNVGTGANQIVQLDGSSKLPAVDGSALSNLNASNLASGTLAAGRLPALSGDVTSSAGSSATTVTKLQGNAVKTGVPGTNGQVLTWVAANSDWEPIAPSSGSVTSVTANNGLSGGMFTTSGTIGLSSIANNTFLANTSGSSAVPAATTLTALIDSSIGNTQGNILYRDTNANGWKVLAPGTAGQVLASGGASANPTWANAASSSGSSSITTVGTVTTGTWNATAIAVPYGGTGLTSGTSGGIPYFASSSTMASSAALAQYGIVLGGGAGAAPSTLAPGTTSYVLTSNGPSSAPTYQQVSLTAGVSGALPVANGGTGATSATTARSNLSAATSGANADISSTTGLTSISSSTSAITIAPTGALNLNPSTSVISSAAIQSILGSVTVPAFGNSTTTNTGVYFPTATSLAITTNGVQRMALDNAGNVTIGSGSQGNLTVNGVALVAAASGANGTSTTIDFSTGNLQYSTATGCTSLNIIGVKEGGSYMVAMQSLSGSPTCTFGANWTLNGVVQTSSGTLHAPSTITAGSAQTIFNFVVIHGHLYVTYLPYSS